MDIYLIQHAQAKSSEEDPARPLSEEGEANIRRVAGYAGKLDVRIDRIYHSGKLRAKQTSEIIAKHIETAGEVEAKSGLNPSDDPRPIMDWIEGLVSEGVGSLTIVGHLPFLDKLASLLVAGVEDANVVAFQNSGIVKLVPKTSGNRYSIEWVLTTEIV